MQRFEYNCIKIIVMQLYIFIELYEYYDCYKNNVVMYGYIDIVILMLIYIIGSLK